MRTQDSTVKSATRTLKSGKVVRSMVRHRRGFVPRDMPTYTGVSIAKAYNAPTGLKGSGIAIVEYGGGWQQADVNQAAILAGCHVPVITDVEAGLSNSPGGDADDEVALDIQAAMGVISYMTGAPAEIYMIWADSQQEALNAIGALIDSGKSIGAVSVSWGSDEGDGDEQADSAGIQAFSAKYGIPFCCATGDNDDGSGSTVDEPADSPYAVGVSGTTKTTTSEYVWNGGAGEGTGGGESDIFPMPSYQQGVIPTPPASGEWRVTGDVAAIGDPATGLNTVIAGQVSPIGGTSLATPVVAAMLAGMGLPKLVWPDCLYAAKKANPECFTQITEGNNNPAGSGNWEGVVCCGLGVLNGTVLYQTLTAASPAPPTPPSPVPPSPPSPPSPTPPPAPTATTLTLTDFPLTGKFQRWGPPETVSVSGSGPVTVTSVALPPGSDSSCPHAPALATMLGVYRPRSMTWQQWLALIAAILDAINGAVNSNPTAKPEAIKEAVGREIPRPASLTIEQWLSLIMQILQIILPVIEG